MGIVYSRFMEWKNSFVEPTIGGPFSSITLEDYYLKLLESNPEDSVESHSMRVYLSRAPHRTQSQLETAFAPQPSLPSTLPTVFGPAGRSVQFASENAAPVVGP